MASMTYMLVDSARASKENGNPTKLASGPDTLALGPQWARVARPSPPRPSSQRVGRAAPTTISTGGCGIHVKVCVVPALTTKLPYRRGYTPVDRLLVSSVMGRPVRFKVDRKSVVQGK